MNGCRWISAARRPDSAATFRRTGSARQPAVEQPKNRHAAEIVGERLGRDENALRGVHIALGGGPVPPGRVSGVVPLVDKAFQVAVGPVQPPPNHVFRQDITGRESVELEPRQVRAGLDPGLFVGRRRRPPDHDVELPERQQQRRDRRAEPGGNARALAVYVAPPPLQFGRPGAGDLRGVDCATDTARRRTPPRPERASGPIGACID